jgi:hyaluronoglucosaminidase
MKARVIALMLAVAALVCLSSTMSAKTKKSSMKLPLPVGVVEGFYGRPWSHEERLRMIRFMGEVGLNVYCYAPKDDPYHRKDWRKPYPEAELARLKELIAACRQAGVTFCFAVSPGLDIEYSNPSELDTLIGKLDVFIREGVDSYALFFDDVPSSFRHASDARAFPSFAAAHAQLANEVLKRLKARNAKTSLVVCPTEYYHADPTPYLSELAAKLSPEIRLVWTGLGVCSPTVDPPDLLRIRSVLHRKPVLWDNYPVNDYDEGHIYLGPLRNRTPLLGLNLAGYWANPMNEAELSKIPLMTVADFFRSPETYNPETSWRQALQRIGGTRAYPYLLRMADFMTGSFLTRDEGRVLCSLAADYFESPNPQALASLREYLQQLLELETNLDRTLKNRELFEELRPSLKRLRLHVRNLQMALRIDELPTTSAERATLRAALAQGLVAIDTPVTAPAKGSSEWDRLLRDDSTVFPGNVADEVFAQIQQTFFSRWTEQTSPTLPRIIAAPAATRGCFGEFAIDGDPATVYASRNSWKAGEYLAMDFRDTMPTQTLIRITQRGVEKWRNIHFPRLDVEISADGTKWEQVATMSTTVCEVASPRPLRFVRLFAARDTETPFVVEEIRVKAPTASKPTAGR